MKKVFSALLVILLASSSLTGCWDFAEPEDSGLVMALGIHLRDDNQFEVITQDESLTAGGQQFQKSNWNFDIHKTTGSTIYDALQKNFSINPHRTYLAHTKAIIISEELVSKLGFRPVIDFLERNAVIRKNTLFLISKKGEFEKVFLPDAKMNKDTGGIIESLVKEKSSNSFMLESKLSDILELYWGSYTNPYALGVRSGRSFMEDKPIDQDYDNTKTGTYDIDVGDIAVFKNDKLAGWLTGEECRGFLWAESKVSGGFINVTVGENIVTLRILKANSDIRPIIENKKMKMNINVNVEVNIGESRADINFDDKDVIDKTKQSLDRQITKEIREAFDATKKISTDAFGFGNCFYQDYPNYWKTVSGRWYDYYQDLELNIQINSTLQHIGLEKKPDKNVK